MKSDTKFLSCITRFILNTLYNKITVHTFQNKTKTSPPIKCNTSTKQNNIAVQHYSQSTYNHNLSWKTINLRLNGKLKQHKKLCTYALMNQHVHFYNPNHLNCYPCKVMVMNPMVNVYDHPDQKLFQQLKRKLVMVRDLVRNQNLKWYYRNASHPNVETIEHGLILQYTKHNVNSRNCRV